MSKYLTNESAFLTKINFKIFINMVEQLERNISNYSNNEDPDWFADYDMDYGAETALELKNVKSHLDEPKLTRGFSFLLIEEGEIENK